MTIDYNDFSRQKAFRRFRTSAQDGQDLHLRDTGVARYPAAITVKGEESYLEFDDARELARILLLLVAEGGE